MATIPLPDQNTLGFVRRVQAITIAWMSIEAGLSLLSAWRAHSPALVAFGGDAVELLSAVTVMWRFRHRASVYDEKRAAQVAGALLFVLVACVVLVSALSLLGYSEPRPSYLGMAVLVAAALIMPWLAKEKRRLSALTQKRCLESRRRRICDLFLLSRIALVGLAVHAIWHVGWADPIAALAITPFILNEGRQAIRGKPCGCC